MTHLWMYREYEPEHAIKFMHIPPFRRLFDLLFMSLIDDEQCAICQTCSALDRRLLQAWYTQ